MSTHPTSDRPPAYHCTVGHEIPLEELSERTEFVALDKGARVRICREHGAPIAVTLAAGTAGERSNPLI